MGQRGGVVDAIAHHGHATTALLQPLHLARFVLREHFGAHAVDAGLPRDRLGGDARITGEHDDVDPHDAQPLHHRRHFGLEEVGDGEEAEQAAGERQIDYRLAVGGEGLGASTEGGDVDAARVHQRAIAEEDSTVGGHGIDPLARDRLELAHGRQRDPELLGALHDGLAQWVFGALLGGGGQGDNRGRMLVSVRRNHIGHLGLAHRQRSRLVEDDGVGLVEQLERRRALDEHPHFGTASGAHHDRRRGGEPHGAWARDDENGDSVGERVEHGGLGPEERPAREGDGGENEHHGHEDRGHAVGQSLDGRARALRLLHEPDDARERRVAPHARDPEDEASRAVHGAAEDGGLGPLLDGHALARQHRLVHRRGALDDDTVHGEPFAGTHPDEVAHVHLVDGNVKIAALAHHPGGAGSETQQAPDGVGRPAARAGFQPSPQHDEGDDDSGRLVVGHGAEPHERMGPDGDGHTEEVRRARSQGDQCRHAGGAMAKIAQQAEMELAAHPELHGGGEGEEDPGVAEPGRRPPEHLGHAPEHDGHGQHGTGQELRARAPLLPCPRDPRLIIAAGGGAPRRQQLVAGRTHGRPETIDVRPGRVESHRGLLGGEVDGRLLHARHRAEGTLDLAHTGGAVHALHGQGQALHRYFPPKRAKTSSNSSIFRWRSPFDPERSASLTQDSM